MLKLFVAKPAIILLIILLISSCASVVRNNEEEQKSSLKELNPTLSRIEANCVLNSTMNNQSFNFRAKVNISGIDTISMTVFGPFGITVGKLYSDLNYFRFYNIMENTVYQGIPSQENIKKATNLSISMKDFLSLFQGKTPFKISDYDILNNDNDKYILKRVDKDNFGDFAVITKTDMLLKQYQRKDKGDVLILNTSFDKYSNKDAVFIPMSVNLNMPTIGGKLILEIENYKINQEAEFPKMFDIPSSANVIDLK